MADWPYNTRQWRELRSAKLKAQPTCEPCGRRGVIVPANTVDHRIRIAAGGHPFPPLSGLMSMCPSCHNAKTMRGDMHGGVALKGAGADGLPIDPAHPFWGEGASKDSQSSALDRRPSQILTKFRGR